VSRNWTFLSGLERGLPGHAQLVLRGQSPLRYFWALVLGFELPPLFQRKLVELLDVGCGRMNRKAEHKQQDAAQEEAKGHDELLGGYSGSTNTDASSGQGFQ
jgi:hypothetical protein